LSRRDGRFRGTPSPEPYTLVVEVADGGFFSNVNRVVDHLRHSLGSDGCEAIRVNWRVNGSLQEFAYGTPADGELWGSFFEPLLFPRAPTLERTTNLYADYGMTGLRAYRMYKRSSLWRADYGRAYREHVVVRAEILGRVEAVASERMSGRFCVGVHVRHPDHAVELPGPAPSIERFVAQARRLVARGKPAVVVLATDVVEAVERFSDAFGDRLVVQADIARTRWQEPQLQHAQPAARLELGTQVLVDTLLLARCDVLLHVVSNIATAVGYMNPGVRMVYCEPRLVGMRAVVHTRLTRSPPPSSPTGLSREIAGHAGAAAASGSGSAPQ
jgi:hypothetical protein